MYNFLEMSRYVKISFRKKYIFEEKFSTVQSLLKMATRRNMGSPSLCVVLSLSLTVFTFFFCRSLSFSVDLFLSFFFFLCRSFLYLFLSVFLSIISTFYFKFYFFLSVPFLSFVFKFSVFSISLNNYFSLSIFMSVACYFLLFRF